MQWATRGARLVLKQSELGSFDERRQVCHEDISAYAAAAAAHDAAAGFAAAGGIQTDRASAREGHGNCHDSCA